MDIIYKQTKENWSENKNNPMLAVQKTPMIRTLRSRIIGCGKARGFEVTPDYELNNIKY